jgi:hypothetical protein
MAFFHLQSGASMLHAAAQFGHVEVIQLLLSRGFSTAVTNSVTSYPLPVTVAALPLCANVFLFSNC